MMRNVGLALAVLVAAATACSKEVGSNESKAAAAAAIKVFPKETTLIIGVNLAKVRSSKAWGKYSALIIDGDVKEKIDDVKAKCGFDVVKDLTSVVVGMGDDLDSDKPIVVVTGNFDEAKAEKCFLAVMEKEGKKGTVVKDGNVTTYTVEGEDEPAHVGWINANTFVISPGTPGKEGVKALLEGKSSASDNAELNEMVKKANTGSTVWVAMIPKGQAAEMLSSAPGPDVKGIWVNLHYQSDLKLEAGLRYDSESDARDAAKLFKTLAGEMKNAEEIPKVAREVRYGVSQKGKDVVTVLEATEGQIDQIIKLATSQLFEKGEDRPPSRRRGGDDDEE